MKEVLLIIEGKVQGVWYRSTAKDFAKQLGIKGYAKNLTDGTVKILAQGDKASLQKFIDACREGSASAEVTNIKETWREPGSQHSDFEVL